MKMMVSYRQLGLAGGLLFAAHTAVSLASPFPGYLRPMARQHGGLGRGQSYLGVDVRDVNDDEVSALKLKEARGAEIVHVDHDGPAGKMGLRERDVVTQMNGVAIEGEEQIRKMLHDTPAGRAVVFVILRDGQPMTVTAQMADRDEVERQAWERHLSAPPALPASDGVPAGPADASVAAAPAVSLPAPRYGKSFLGSLLTSPTYTGAMLERVGPQLASFFGVSTGTGLLVRGVDNNSPAAMAGIHAGDVVVRADSRTLVTMTQWAKAIRDAKGRPVTVVIVRDRQEKTVTLTPDIKRRSSLQYPSLPAVGPVSGALANLKQL